MVLELSIKGSGSDTGVTNPEPWGLAAEKGFVTLATRLLDELDPARIGVQKARMGSVRLFGDLFGDMAIDQISRSQGAQFVGFLVQSLAQRTTAKRPRTEAGAVTWAGEGSQKLLSPKTISQHVYALAWLWNLLARDRHLDPNSNPFVGHALPPVVQKKRGGFQRRDVEKIFRLPVYSSDERPAAAIGEVCFWLPLLLLWTGARPEEIADLRIADLRPCGPDHAVISFRSNTPGSYSGAVLNSASAQQSRTFPIPDALIALGLLEYLEWLGLQGAEFLFPELHSKRTMAEQLSRFSHWWAAYLRSKGAIAPGQKPMRELQRTWLAEAHHCGVTAAAQQYLVGEGREGESPAPETALFLGQEIQKIRYNGWNFDYVRRWSRPAVC